MIELADIATLVFIASGVTYQGVKYWRSDKRVRLKRELPVSLILRQTVVTESITHAVVVVFDRRGCLVRKFPDAEIIRRKKYCKLPCSSAEGRMNFCVLFTSCTLSLSGIHCRADIDRQFASIKDLLIAETGLQDISTGISLELTLTSGNKTTTEEPEATPTFLSMLLPPELTTDAMAKELTIDLTHCSEPWSTGRVHYTEGEPDNWLALRREGEKLVLQLRTNFCAHEREATAELHTDEHTCLLRIRQQVMGIHPTLTISSRLYVSTGKKNEIVPLTVTPDNEQVAWRIKSANANDGGCWYTVNPPVGIHQKGTKTLKVHLEAKPANVRSRSLVLTLEAGTYPFSQTTEITLMQGVCFDYYIEYPAGDICSRHSGVIETPSGYNEANGLKTYTVCVDSNQCWRIIRDKQADWVEVSEPELLSGHYSGRFTVHVRSNAGNRVKNGFPAARHTILSLVNDTGIVKDILIYQGGYVRICGQYWLDRNLTADGGLAPVAIPLGLEEGSKTNHGSYFQFGSKTGGWSETYACCKENWYEGTAENPARIPEADPSPEGWRVPSYIEIKAFINRTAAPMELQREEDRTNICILSDDGVPVYLPLCGHRSHINGCRIVIPHGHRYWTGSSQSPVYGYSLCVEPSRQMYIMHDMKKYGFPIRCILDGE
ncbi:hypothetical protein [Bacteroides nordii]|nr:hypothetical protein [Bacteroides nordii]